MFTSTFLKGLLISAFLVSPIVATSNLEAVFVIGKVLGKGAKKAGKKVKSALSGPTKRTAKPVDLTRFQKGGIGFQRFGR